MTVYWGNIVPMRYATLVGALCAYSFPLYSEGSAMLFICVMLSKKVLSLKPKKSWLKKEMAVESVQNVLENQGSKGT